MDMLANVVRTGVLASAALIVMAGHVCAQEDPIGGEAVADNSTPPTRWLPVDEDGWTVFQPGPDSRLIYVSTSAGDDATATCCAPEAREVGADPFRPAGEVKPFKTIAAAMAQARAGFPDWVLLKRGDVWDEPVGSVPSGRSRTEPFLLAAYGAAPERPLLNGLRPGVTIGSPKAGVQHVAVVSIALYPSWLDPGSPDYAADQRPAIESKKLLSSAGIYLRAGPRVPLQNILIEDCLLSFCRRVSLNSDGPMKDVVLRRNLILDNYPPTGHTSGFFAGGSSSLLVEENVFDHNGWLYPAREETKGKQGLASLRSHNTYFSSCHNIVFRGNMFLRSSSIGTKWTANKGPGSSADLVIDDNLYVEGELGLSIGGNEPGPLRFANVRVTNNVLLDIGRTRPTGRQLGWYLHVADWDGGLVAGNLFLHQASDRVTSVYGVHVGSHTRRGQYKGEGVHCRNVTIRDNIIHGLKSGLGGIVIERSDLLENILITGNAVQFEGLTTRVVSAGGGVAGVTFANNTYYTDAETDRWFAVGGNEFGFEAWIEESGEQRAVCEKVVYPGPGRTVETYMAALGKEPTLGTFIAEVRKQSKTNWHPEYTAFAVNEWVRAGFGTKRIAAND